MPARLTLPPVSTMKGTKLCWSGYLAPLVAAFTSAAYPGVVSAPALTCRLVPAHTTPTSRSHVVPSLCTLMSPRRWSAAPCGFSTLNYLISTSRTRTPVREQERGLLAISWVIIIDF